MGIKEFTKSTSGKECGYPQFTKEEIETAKENGFVIVYGAFDGAIEFDGVFEYEMIYPLDEKIYFDRQGIVNPEEKVFLGCINTVCCGGEKDANGQEITWTYETDIPHETFMIYKGGEPYCRGIVFRIEDVK